jgi:hypothetical protein
MGKYDAQGNEGSNAFRRCRGKGANAIASDRSNGKLNIFLGVLNFAATLSKFNIVAF